MNTPLIYKYTTEVNHVNLGVNYYTYVITWDNGIVLSSYFMICSEEAMLQLCEQCKWEIVEKPVKLPVPSL